MRRLKLFLTAALLLTAGLLGGCNQQPPRMKNQPPDLKSGDTKVNLPGKKKTFNAAN